MAWPLCTVWAEFEIIRLREGGRMVSESLLQQSMLGATLSKKGEGPYKKHLDRVQNGR